LQFTPASIMYQKLAGNLPEMVRSWLGGEDGPCATHIITAMCRTFMGSLR
jgi:hypothetical protein